MIYVDKHGKRVTNEKLAYNESAQAFFKWDPAKSEYPNLVLIAIWDQRSQEQFGERRVRPLHRAEGHRRRATSSRARRSTELAPTISDARSRKYAGADRQHEALADDFDDEPARRRSPASTTSRKTARTSISTAASGRSSSSSTARRPTTRPAPNPTMYPISRRRPVLRRAADRRQSRHQGRPGDQHATARCSTAMGKPIPGLYGVGNCVASASARAYWAGGATLGPVHRLRLSRGQRRPPRAGKSSPDRAPTAGATIEQHREERSMALTHADDDRRAAQVGRDRISQGLRQWRRDLDRRLDPRPLRRRRAGLFPEMGHRHTARTQIGKMFGDVGGTLKSIVHHYSHFNWIFSGSDIVVCEGTSHGEHQDGPWRAGVPELGGRPLVRRVRDPRLEDPALLHLPRPRLRRKGHGPLPVAEGAASNRSNMSGGQTAGDNKNQWEECMTNLVKSWRELGLRLAAALPVGMAGRAGRRRCDELHDEVAWAATENVNAGGRRVVHALRRRA